MRNVLVAVILLANSLARAGEPDTHDGGMDTGAKVALAGGIAFSAVYSTTALTTGIGDGLCGLDETGYGCAHPHTNLYVPLVGGFLPGRDDWSQSWGVASSVLQIGAMGVMVAGLAVHHWRVHGHASAAR
jgi:hypothetical protein